MTPLEEAVRETLAAAVESPPPISDPAGRAIRRARRARQRRLVGAGVLTLLTAFALTGALVQVQQWRVTHSGDGYPAGAGSPVAVPQSPVPTGAPSTPARDRARLDIVAGAAVWTVDGPRLGLAGVSTVERAYRVPAGWVLGTDAGVILLRTDGSSVALDLGAAWVLSADGSRLAYALSGTVTVARLDRSGATRIDSATVVPGAVPVTFAGVRVVLAAPGPSGRLDRFDHWRPGSPYRPTWTQRSLDLLDTPSLDPVGLAGGSCLTKVSLPGGELRSGGSPAPLACAATTTVDSPGPVVSPDGRWVAVTAGDGARIHQLTSGPGMAIACAAGAGRHLAWETPTALLVSDGTSAVRCLTDGRAEQVDLPAGLPAGWRFVPNRLPTTAG